MMILYIQSMYVRIVSRVEREKELQQPSAAIIETHSLFLAQENSFFSKKN